MDFAVNISHYQIFNLQQDRGAVYLQKKILRKIVHHKIPKVFKRGNRNC